MLNLDKRIKDITSNITAIDRKLLEKARERIDKLTKPPGSLGRLEEIAKQIVAIRGEQSLQIKHKVVIVMAGDHGVVAEGVSAFPQEVTSQMLYNFVRGGAAINVFARHIGARITVVDIGVASDIKQQPEIISKKICYGTKNIAKGPAMKRIDALKSIVTGIEIAEAEFKKGLDILAIGDMGIGNTTPSSAIISVITGQPPKQVTGRGTGIDDKMLANKIKVIEHAIKINKPNPKDPIDVLSKVGGFEIGGLVGVILLCASQNVPVIIDGFISTASALIAYQIEPKVKDYIIAGHKSQELGHRVALEYLGLKPILDLDMRLGEGAGAVLAMGIIEAAVKMYNEMSTFHEAGVSEKKR